MRQRVTSGMPWHSFCGAGISGPDLPMSTSKTIPSAVCSSAPLLRLHESGCRAPLPSRLRACGRRIDDHRAIMGCTGGEVTIIAFIIRVIGGQSSGCVHWLLCYARRPRHRQACARASQSDVLSFSNTLLFRLRLRYVGVSAPPAYGGYVR